MYAIYVCVIYVYMIYECMCVVDVCVWYMCVYVCDVCVSLYVCDVCAYVCIWCTCRGCMYIYMYKMQMCIATLCAVCWNLRKTSGVSSLLPLQVPPGIKLRSSGSRGRCFTHWGSCHLRGFLERLVRWPWRHLARGRCPVNVTFLSSSGRRGSRHPKLGSTQLGPGVHALCELTPYPLLLDFPLQMLANLPWNGGMRMFSAAMGFTQSMCGGRNYARLVSFVTIHTHTSTFIFDKCLQR